jgi:hypothetical protein
LASREGTVVNLLIALGRNKLYFGVLDLAQNGKLFGNLQNLAAQRKHKVAVVIVCGAPEIG